MVVVPGVIKYIILGSFSSISWKWNSSRGSFPRVLVIIVVLGVII